MEAILTKLLLPDNEAIAQGTQELREAMKSAEIIPELCSVMTTSPTVQIRQYAALLLRKKFGKFEAWMRLTPPTRAVVKTGCLNALVSETEKTVKMSIAQLIAVIAKHELKPGNVWSELTQFLHQHLHHDDPGHRLLGMYTMSVLCETTGDQVKPMLRQFGKVFQRALQDDYEDIGFYAIRALTHLVIHIGSDEVHVFQPLLGLVIDLVHKLVVKDEEKAAEAMEIFDELFESEVAAIVPQIGPILELCMKIAAEERLGDPIRVKAIAFLGRLTRLKKKQIVKQKLYIQMINVLFPIMSQISSDDEGDDDEDGGNQVESNSPSMCACQSLDMLAINLPAEKFMPALLSHVLPALQGSDPSKMKGAFNALAVAAEGCSEHIRTKYLVSFLQVIGTGIKHDNHAVRNAALYALGQFSEYLQPDISEYAGEIIPVLLQYLDAQCFQICQQQGVAKTPPGLDRIFYALEIYCDNLEGEKLVPFLPDLMKRLLTMLGDNFSVRTKELSIAGIGAAANAAKAAIIPFFEDITSHLKKYLTGGYDKNNQALLTQSMDVLGILARAVGPTSFAPALAEECCKLGLELCNAHNDPDVRKCAYALFASVAFVVKEEMAVVLPQITSFMFHSCSSKEGISFELKETETELPLDELSDDEDGISLGTEDSSSDLENVKAINVENSYMEEKEQAVEALKEICKYAGAAFQPYLSQSSEECWKLLEFPDEDVRKAAVEACVEFAIAYHKQGCETSMEAFNKANVSLVPKLCHMVRGDEEVSVVCVCLDEIVRLLKTCTTSITAVTGHPEMIIQCVHLVMKSECACMDPDDDDEGAAEEDTEAEQDEILFEYAGEVVPALGMAMAPSAFSPYFAGLLPHLLKKTKKHCNISERSFSAGTLAECMKPLSGVLDHFVSVLLPVFLVLTKDADDDVRNNAVYGLGEMVLHGGSPMYEHFASVLQNLSNLLSHEQSPRVIDQIVGAVCRLILANRDIVPVRDVLPVVFSHLPLKQDDEEYEMVFRCLLELYNVGEPLLKDNLTKVLGIAGDVHGKGVNEGTEAALVQLVMSFYRDAKTEFAVAVGQLPPGTAANIAKIIS